MFTVHPQVGSAEGKTVMMEGRTAHVYGGTDAVLKDAEKQAAQHLRMVPVVAG